MANLKQGERIEYVIYVSEQDIKAREFGEKLLTRSFEEDLQRNPVGAWARFPNQNPREKYAPELMKLFGEKLASGLMRTYIWVQIDAANPGSLTKYVEAWLSAMKDFGGAMPYQILDLYGKSLQIQVDDRTANRSTSVLQTIANWLDGYADRYWREPCILSVPELTTLWHLPHERFAAPTIEWIRGKHVPLPADMRGKASGVYLGDNLYAGRRESVYMLPQDRRTHMIVVGKTGMGKSTLLHNLIRQDIQNGCGVAVIDPSPGGSLIRAILQSSIPEEREKDVVVWDLANWQHPPPLNLLRISPGIQRQHAAASVKAIFEKIYGSEFSAARMGHTLAMAVQTLMADKSATIRDIPKLYRDPEYRMALIQQVESEAAVEFWEDFENMREREQREYFEPIVRRMEVFYDSPLLYPVMCYPDTLNIRAIIRTKKIFLVSLAAPQNAPLSPHEQALLGSILVSQFQLAIQAEASHDPFYLYVDEAQHFVTTAIDEIFNEARKQNLSLILANQFLEQLAGRTLKAVMGNVGAVVAFQVGDDDARTLSNYTKPQFEAYDLSHLEVHQAAVFMRYNGSLQPAFSIQPQPISGEIQHAAGLDKEARIRRLSIKQYTPHSREQIVEWLSKRYPRKVRPSPTNITSEGDHFDHVDTTKDNVEQEKFTSEDGSSSPYSDPIQ